MKIYIHVAHDQMNQLLEPKAFDNYNNSPMQVRLVFTDTGNYFEVYDWLTNYTYEVCVSVSALNKFFIHNEEWPRKYNLEREE